MPLVFHSSEPGCSNVHKRRITPPNRMNFRKNSKRPSTPAPTHFRKIMLQFFYDGYGRIYARRCEGQIMANACTWFPDMGTILWAFFKVCLVLIFLKTIVEKTYPEPWNYSFNCLKLFGLKMPPPPSPLWYFSENSSDLALPSFPKVCNLKRDWNYAWDPGLMVRFKRLSCSFFPLSRNILCTTWLSSTGGVVEYQWSNFFHSPVQTWAKCSSSKFEGR